MPIQLEQLSDTTLTQRLDQFAARDRATTAELLAHIAEFDRRRLYAPAGHSSMHGYCVDRLRMSDDTAFARIRTARASRRFPGILAAIEDGRLNVSGVVLLVPHLKVLTREAGRELLRAAVNKRHREIRLLLAERFPQPDVPAQVVPIGPVAACPEFRQLVAPPVAGNGVAVPTAQIEAETPVAVPSSPPMAAEVRIAEVPVPTHARVAPLAPGRFVFQMTIGQSAHDKLTRLKALLSHEIPSGDLEQVFERALEIAIAQLEKRKYGAAGKPRSGRSRSSISRHTPAAVRRAVRRRDQERCTYVSPDGRRCDATAMLEFDHIVPYALGGEATASNIRLCCRTHNQLAAERVFGESFMERKREQARLQADASAFA